MTPNEILERPIGPLNSIPSSTPAIPMVNPVVAKAAVVQAAEHRRRHKPKWTCSLCSATFTRKYNLDCTSAA